MRNDPSDDMTAPDFWDQEIGFPWFKGTMRTAWQLSIRNIADQVTRVRNTREGAAEVAEAWLHEVLEAKAAYNPDEKKGFMAKTLVADFTRSAAKDMTAGDMTREMAVAMSVYDFLRIDVRMGKTCPPIPSGSPSNTALQ